MKKLKDAGLLLLILLIYSSCTKTTRQGNNAAPDDSLYTRDTISVNGILRQVKAKDYRNADSALKSLRSAQDLSLKCNYDEGLVQAYFLEGNILYQRNNYEDALESYSKAKTLAEKNDYLLLKAQCLERMASVHLATDDPNLSLMLYYEALPLFEKSKYKPGIAKVYNIIGIYKTDKNQFDTAEIYFRKAMRINEETGDHYNLIENKGNLGYLYERSGETGKAVKIYLELVAELAKMEDSLSLPMIYFDLSSIQQKKNDLDSATYFLRKALAISEPFGDTSLLSTLYLATGHIFMQKGKFDSAHVFLLKSISCTEAIGATNTEIDALKLLSELDSLQGDYKSALEKSRQIAVLKDTLYQRKIRHNLKVSELQYENEKKKNLIKVQHTHLQASEKERLFYIILFIISLIAILFIGIAWILQKRTHVKNKELYEKQLQVNNLELERVQKEEEINRLQLDRIEENLKVKERELVSTVIGIEQRNELLDRIIKKIEESIRNETKSISIAELNEIISSIKLQLNKQKGDDPFNQQFAQVHPDFFMQLKETHPHLTKSDLKFCAYLRIHLSSSQIATILNVTPEAIRKTRYRVRKKIQLLPNDSLEDYVAKF